MEKQVSEVNYPIINGHRYSFASITISVNNVAYCGIESISYGSVGESNYCELEVYSKEAREILKQLGDRFHEKKFNLTVQYSENPVEDDKEGDPLKYVDTDTLFGVSIHSVESINHGEPMGLPSTLKLKLNVPYPILFSGLKR